MPFPSPDIYPGTGLFPGDDVPVGGGPAGYVPQFDAPFRLGNDGQPVTNPQGSLQDTGASVYNVMVCPQGAFPNDPTWGIPWPVFELLNLDTSAIVSAIQTLVPDATVAVVQEQIQRVQQLQPARLAVTAQVQSGS